MLHQKTIQEGRADTIKAFQKSLLLDAIRQPGMYNIFHEISSTM